MCVYVCACAVFVCGEGLCVSVCVSGRMCVRTVFVRVRMYATVCVYVCMYVCACMCLYLSTSVRVYVRMCMRVSV